MLNPAAGPAEKVFRQGTHRSATPEETLARVAPIAAAAGITRVAVLTGLDTIGIPVAAAYRPNSKTIAVHQGKGATLAAAKVSAVMEAIETFHAETADLPLRQGRFAEIGRHGAALDPHTLARTGPGDLRGQPLLWTPGTSLADGRCVWVPFDLVRMDLTAAAIGANADLQATTNGLASGNHRQEALVHALCEVVERDAVALWQAMPAVMQDRCALNMASVDDPAARAWLKWIADAGVAAQIWDVTSDIRVPAFACLLDGADGVQPELGCGCHPDRAVALLRAVGEAAQARLTVISGARDDLPVEGYGEPATRRRRAAARAWMRGPGERDYHEAPDCAGPTIGDDLRIVCAALEDAGAGGAVWIDLERPEFGIPVVRVIVPGLEGPWTRPGGGYWPGARARAMPS
ncbi:YcaO-like family protein [Acidisphaera sp. L21]|uniref:YcaO-like family protein n=1 Tax=Acidisphaera sp. L21 TaxID=1641851 RepID=UPI00131CEB6B|nr:YcaO-like family protein [Acidisphaera sp. L21]